MENKKQNWMSEIHWKVKWVENITRQKDGDSSIPMNFPLDYGSIGIKNC